LTGVGVGVILLHPTHTHSLPSLRSTAWATHQPAGCVRPLKAASSGGWQVPSGCVVLQLGRRRFRVVSTVTATVRCSSCHGGLAGAPVAGTSDIRRKLLQWRCGLAVKLLFGQSGRGGDASSCAMRMQRVPVALGESPHQLHAGGMATTSSDVVFSVWGGIILSEL
jgi:hypothetical protein